MIVYVIVGLPGSGKTHYGKQLSMDNNIPFFDDCATDIDVSDAFEQHIAEGKDCVVADPGFCIEGVKAKLLEKIYAADTNAEILFTYFENDPDTCAKNVVSRTDGRKVSKRFAHSLSAWYSLPSNVSARPCFKRS